MKRNRRFIFKTDYRGVAKGTQLDLVEGRYFMQNGIYGGPISGDMYAGIDQLIAEEDARENPVILREVPVPYNKA